MLAVIIQGLKRKKIATMAYCLASMFFMWMYIVMYPTIAEQSAEFEKAFSSYPDEFFQIFNIEELKFDSVEKFLSVEHYSIVWPMMVLFFTISLAGFLIAMEVEKGTLSLILARPISRFKIFISRYLAGFISLIIFSIFSVLIAIPLCALHNVRYDLRGHITTLILCLLFGGAIFSLAMMFSAFFSEKSKVYMVMGGGLMIMYVFNVAANLHESWEKLKYFSFFHYFDYNASLIDHTISRAALMVFIITIVISFISGLIIFNRRDIAI